MPTWIMDPNTTQELVLKENSFFSHPPYTQGDVCDDYKVLMKNIADQLAEEDLGKIRHFCDLPSAVNSASSLDVLTQLERRGQFTPANIDPLKELLQKVDRCDLVNRFVDPFILRQRSLVQKQGTQSLPLGNLGGYSTLHASGSEEKSSPYATYTGGQRYGPGTPRPFIRPSSRPNLSSVSEDDTAFLPPPTDAAPPGLRRPLPTSSAGYFYTRNHTSTLPRYPYREQQECVSDSQMSFSLSAQFPSQTNLASSSLHETASRPDERSELALHSHRPSPILPSSNAPPAELAAAEFTSYSSTSGKRPSPPIPIPGNMTPHSMSTASSHQQVERQHSQDRRKKSTPIGQHATALGRKKMVNCIRDHQYDKYIKVRHRLVLNLGCKNNPQLRFKLWPCGLEDDKDESVTFQADVYFPVKCSAAVVRSIVRLTVTATDNQTGGQINSCSAEFSLHSRGTTVNDLIQHRVLIKSKSVTIGLTVKAEVLEFHPEMQSEAEINIEEVPSPMAEYQQRAGEMLIKINQRPETIPIPETQ